MTKEPHHDPLQRKPKGCSNNICLNLKPGVGTPNRLLFKGHQRLAVSTNFAANNLGVPFLRRAAWGRLKGNQQNNYQVPIWRQAHIGLKCLNRPKPGCAKGKPKGNPCLASTIESLNTWLIWMRVSFSGFLLLGFPFSGLLAAAMARG